MTYRELSQYRNLIRKIEQLETEKLDLIKIASPSFEGMPHGSGTSDPVARTVEKMDKLNVRIDALRIESIERLHNIEEYIGSIDDEAIQVIFRYRFILGYNYEKIGELLYMDRRTVARKIDGYIVNNAHNARQ